MITIKEKFFLTARDLSSMTHSHRRSKVNTIATHMADNKSSRIRLNANDEGQNVMVSTKIGYVAICECAEFINCVARFIVTVCATIYKRSALFLGC